MVNEIKIYELQKLLESILGSGKQMSRGNYAFSCPNKCHPTKHKLEINLTTQQYQCWICGGRKDGYKGQKLINLLKKLKTSPDKISAIRALLPSTGKQVEQTIDAISLPKEFKSLYPAPTDLMARHALAYLKSRNIGEEDIVKYNIGYCEYGEHANMIIVPSYDENGILNYFSARNFNKNSSIKYKNPPVSRDTIPFEFYINWDSPLTLCEGVFDALAIKRNAIPLLGKTLPPSLMKKIVKSSVQKIYIALDKDAIKDALGFCEELLNEGKKVYLVELPDKDPSEMGFLSFTNLIQQTQKLSFSQLFEKKLQLI